MLFGFVFVPSPHVCFRAVQTASICPTFPQLLQGFSLWKHLLFWCASRPQQRHSTPAPPLASSGEDEECSYEEGGDEEHSSLYGELTHHFGEETGAYFAFFQVMSSLTAL